MTTDLCLPIYLRRDEMFYLNSEGIYRELIVLLRKERYLPMTAHMILNYASYYCDAYLQGSIYLDDITGATITDEDTSALIDTKLVVPCALALILVLGNGKVDNKTILRAYLDFITSIIRTISRDEINILGAIESLLTKARKHPELLQPVFHTETQKPKDKSKKNDQNQQIIIVNTQNSNLSITIKDGVLSAVNIPNLNDCPADSKEDNIPDDEKDKVLKAICDRLYQLDNADKVKCDCDKLCAFFKSALGMNNKQLGSTKDNVTIQNQIWNILTRKRAKCEKESKELYFSQTFLNIVGYLYEKERIEGKKADIIDALYPETDKTKKPGMIKCLERNITKAFPQKTKNMFDSYLYNH